MVWVKYHLPLVWNKHLLTKNIWYHKIIFSLKTLMFSLTLSFVRLKHHVSLNILLDSIALLAECQTTQCVVLSVQYFYLWRNKDPLAFLSTWYKRAAGSFIYYVRQIFWKTGLFVIYLNYIEAVVQCNGELRIPRFKTPPFLIHR